MKKDKRTILRGEVYMCDLGDKAGSVQAGYRPVVVVQNNYGNAYSDTVIIAPITSRTEVVQPTQMSITLDKESIILCEQITTVQKKELKNKIYYLSGEEMTLLNHALMSSLGL